MNFKLFREQPNVTQGQEKYIYTNTSLKAPQRKYTTFQKISISKLAEMN